MAEASESMEKYFAELEVEEAVSFEKDLKLSWGGKILELNLKCKKFFEKLLNLFKITVQMRNSITNSETDYLISPVMNAKGEFYDSRKAGDNLPKDADANGAYHIAKKGLWLLKQIDAHEGEDWKKLKLAITNKEWLQFAQARGRL